MPHKPKDQIQKFRAAARKHEADESEEVFNAALKAVATNKNVTPALDKLAEELGQTGKPRRPKRT